MRTKLICGSLALTLALAPLHAQAQDLSGAFSSLLGTGAATVNAPGAFSSQARSGISAGGVEVRVPRVGGNTPQLLSVTPPRITAGCQGISAHFGGFSFISGAEFSALLKQIASGAALGFVTSLVMKTLCPPCEAIVQELKTAAAAASKNLGDSCKWGQDMAAKFMEGNGGLSKSQTCATILADANKSPDSGSAWAGSCNAIASATAAIRELLPSEKKGTPAEQAAQAEANSQTLACDFQAGNITWARLSAFDLDKSSPEAILANQRRKELLINIMGAELSKGDGSLDTSCEEDGKTFRMSEEDTATSKPEKTHYCKPTADIKLLTGLFLCGAPEANGVATSAILSARTKAYCSGFFGKDMDMAKATTTLWTCGDDPQKCLNLKHVAAGTIVQGEGFMVAVNKLLMNAVERVKAGTGFDDEDGRKIIQLIQVAPYPLYQAINAAAVYPAAGMDLIDSMSILVGEQFAYAMLDETLKISNRKSASNCALSQAQSTKMLDFITSFRTENQARLRIMGQNFAVQQGITKQIHEINLAIQQQTMSEDLLGASRLTESINSAVTPIGKVSK